MYGMGVSYQIHEKKARGSLEGEIFKHSILIDFGPGSISANRTQNEASVVQINSSQSFLWVQAFFMASEATDTMTPFTFLAECGQTDTQRIQEIHFQQKQSGIKSRGKGSR